MAGKLKRAAKRRHVPYTKFKAWMAENDVKQEQLGELLNKTKTTINQNLNGTGGDFSVKDIRTICLHYGISSDAYFIHQKVS